MGDLMDDAIGVGLAATQVGVAHRVLVYRVEAESPTVALVNPQVEWSGEETESMEEGCLSLPGVLVDVERPSTCASARRRVRRADRDRGLGTRGARDRSTRSITSTAC